MVVANEDKGAPVLSWAARVRGSSVLFTPNQRAGFFHVRRFSSPLAAGGRHGTEHDDRLFLRRVLRLFPPWDTNAGPPG